MLMLLFTHFTSSSATHYHNWLFFFFVGSSSDSDSPSLSEEDDDWDENLAMPAKTPLAAFLSFKQEAERRRASTVQLDVGEKVEQGFHTITTTLPPTNSGQADMTHFIWFKNMV